MTAMRCIGVDAGVNGACALVLPDGTTVPGGVFDIPTVGEGNKREIDYAALRDLIWAVRPTHAVIEIVNAFMPSKKNDDGSDKKNEDGSKEKVQFGATSMFRFGGAYYAIRAVIGCLDIPLYSVTSGKWQEEFNLRGKAKSGSDAARQVVIERYPAIRPFVTLKKHQHRADSFLIGVYGSRKITRQEENLDIPD
jgi:hypothetical protein